MSNSLFENEPEPEVQQEAPKRNNEHEYTDIFTRIVDIIDKLPTFYIDDHLFKRWFNDHFGKTAIKFLKDDFKANPLNVISRNILTYDQRSAMFAITQIFDLMCKNKTMGAVSSFVRNVAILDSIVGAIPEKFAPSESSEQIREFKEFLKAAGLESDVGKYTCVSKPSQAQSIYTFGGFAATHEVGETFDAYFPSTSQYDNINHMQKTKITLLYKSHSVVANEQEGGYIVKGVNSRKKGETEIYLKLKIVIPPENNNVGERTDYIYMSVGYSPNFKDLVDRGDIFVASKHNYYCGCRYDYLSLSILDPRALYLHIYGTNGTICIQKRIPKTVDSIHDTVTDKISESIKSSVDLGYSRGYAFVGVPGTGKTHLAEQIADQFTDSVILYTSLRNTNQLVAVVNSFRSMPCKHMIIIADDFDKNDKIKDGNYNQELITMFAQLHYISDQSKKVFTLIATINNPTLVCNAIIKRSGRIDEVIRVDIPSVNFLGNMFNKTKHENDMADYMSLKFRLLYRYMRRKKITLADTKNIYTTMRIGKKSSNGDKLHYGVRDMLAAVKVITANKTNANEDYTL